MGMNTPWIDKLLADLPGYIDMVETVALEFGISEERAERLLVMNLLNGMAQRLASLETSIGHYSVLATPVLEHIRKDIGDTPPWSDNT